MIFPVMVLGGTKTRGGTPAGPPQGSKTRMKTKDNKKRQQENNKGQEGQHKQFSCPWRCGRQAEGGLGTGLQGGGVGAGGPEGPGPAAVGLD